MKAILSTVMLALAMICTCTQAQENTTDYWMDRANVLIHKDLEEEAVLLTMKS